MKKVNSGFTIDTNTPSYLSDPKFKHLSPLDPLESHEIEIVRDADADRAHPTKRRKLDNGKKTGELGIGAFDVFSDDDVVALDPSND